MGQSTVFLQEKKGPMNDSDAQGAQGGEATRGDFSQKEHLILQFLLGVVPSNNLFSVNYPVETISRAAEAFVYCIQPLVQFLGGG